MNEKYTAGALVELLKLRHPEPWATFAELRRGTGFTLHADQRLDFFAVHTWPSEKYRSIAYEIKVSRSDFLRELERPGKREFAESVANECWFVMPVGVAQGPFEIPTNWGMLECTKGGLRVKKAAQQNFAIKPWSMSFIASLLRQSSKYSTGVSKTMWLRAGEELDEEALIKIAEETFNRNLQDAKQRQKYAVEIEFEHGEKGRRLRELELEIRRVTGMWEPTAESFAAWVSLGRLPADATRELRRAHEALGKLLAHSEEKVTA